MKILLVQLAGSGSGARAARWAAAGHAARVVVTQLDALKCLQRESVDRVVLDGSEAAAEALELAARIRQWERGAEIPTRLPVLAVLPGDDPLAVRAAEAGVNDTAPAGDEAALDAWLARNPSRLDERLHSGETAPVLDRHILEDISGGDTDELRDMMDLFFETSRGQIEGIETALRDTRKADIGRLAHKCGGAAMTCGLPALAAALTHLEHLVREMEWTDDHWLSAAQLHSIVRAEFERAQAAIGEILDGRQPLDPA